MLSTCAVSSETPEPRSSRTRASVPHSTGLRAPGAGGGFQERGDEVGGGYVGSPAGGGQGGVAGACGDVEDAFAGVDVDGAAEELADDDLFGPGPGEVALGPHAPGPFGHLGVQLRWRGGGHDVLP